MHTERHLAASTISEEHSTLQPHAKRCRIVVQPFGRIVGTHIIPAGLNGQRALRWCRNEPAGIEHAHLEL